MMLHKEIGKKFLGFEAFSSFRNEGNKSGIEGRKNSLDATRFLLKAPNFLFNNRPTMMEEVGGKLIWA